MPLWVFNNQNFQFMKANFVNTNKRQLLPFFNIKLSLLPQITAAPDVFSFLKVVELFVIKTQMI